MKVMLAACCAGIILLFSRAGPDTEFKFLLNPHARHSTRADEPSFLILSDEMTSDIVKKVDSYGLCKILFIHRTVWEEFYLRGEDINAGAVKQELLRLIGLMEKAHGDNEMYDYQYRMLEDTREELRLTREGVRVLKECIRRLYEGDKSPEIVEMVEEQIRLLESSGIGTKACNHYEFIASYYFSISEDERAIPYLHLSHECFVKSGNIAMISQTAGRLAEYYKRKGDENSAEMYLLECLHSAQSIEDYYHIARALAFLGTLREDQGYFFEAESLYTQSLEYCGLSSRIPCATSKHLALANLYFSCGEMERALYHTEEALLANRRTGRIISSSLDKGDILVENRISKEHAAALGLFAKIQMSKGNMTEAVGSMQEAFDLNRGILDRHISARMEKELGDAYFSAGNTSRAEKCYRNSLRTARKLKENKEIAMYLSDLAKLYFSSGKNAEAHRCIEEASRLAREAEDWIRLSELLHLSGDILVKEGDPESGYGLIKKALYVLNSNYTGRDIYGSGVSIKPFEDEIYLDIIRLQAETFRNPDSLIWWAEHRRQSRRANGDGTDVDPGESISAMLEDRGWIPPDAVIIQYTVTPSAFYIAAFDRERSICRSSDTGSTPLEKKVRAFLSCCYTPCTPYGEGEGPAGRGDPLAAAAGLYIMLIEPVTELVIGKNLICFIPDAVLNHIPFHALTIPERGLIFLEERFRVLTSSNLLYLAGYGEKEDDNTAYFRSPLLIGDPEYSAFARRIFPHICKIPHSGTEIQAASELMGSCIVMQGSSATREAFLETATGSSLIHIAAHTVNYPVFSDNTAFLLSSSQSTRSERELSESILSPEDIRTCDLTGTGLVVLASCESACGTAGFGSDESGLADAFMEAGAENVISALWPIEDRHTEIFITHFFDMLSTGKDILESLHLTRLDMISEARMTGDPASGIDRWGAFTLRGPFSGNSPSQGSLTIKNTRSQNN